MYILTAFAALCLAAPLANISPAGGVDVVELQALLPEDDIAAWTWTRGERGHHWYAMTTKATNFAAAEGQAMMAGGHLVTIETGGERDFLVEQFAPAEGGPVDRQTASLWIGLRRRVAMDPYQWTSGEERISADWADGEPRGKKEASAWAALFVQGDQAGSWHEVTAGDDVRFGIIEIDFDPAFDPLLPAKKSAQKNMLALVDARKACLAAADESAESIDLDGAREELEILRKEKLTIIHTKPKPTSAETRAASDAVQDWIDARLDKWMKKSRAVRLAVTNLEKAHKKVAKGQTYPMTARAARTDIFCAMLDRDLGEQAERVHAHNRRVMLRAETTPNNYAIVTWTNEHRRMMGLRVLVLDNRLTYGAQVHANDMSALGFFEHDSPVPGHANVRARCSEGGHFRSTGENLHMGGNAGIGSVQGWIGSPGHHSNMLTYSHGTIGPGIKGSYSVEVFGIPPMRR